MDGKSLKRSGERGRNRTYNLLIKSQLLCQLSYAPFKDFRGLRIGFYATFALFIPSHNLGEFHAPHGRSRHPSRRI